MTVNDQGGGVIQWDTKDISPTLRSQMKHHEPIVVLEIHEDENDNNDEVCRILPRTIGKDKRDRI